ncbi:MAG: hypothetical protein ACP5XB_02460 [Isosphaeraceae bacterium]
MFDQSSIKEVKPPVWDGSALQLEWSSTAPSGTVFQVYASRTLVWSGTSTWVALPMPSGPVRIDIGTVGPGEAAIDFSTSLPAAPQDRAQLSWLGGTYLDPTGNDDVAGFQIYGEVSPGGGIDYQNPLAKINAYPGGILTDGFGLGGFGQGGFGRAASTYTWTSPALSTGTWSFAVVSVDAAGNQGAPTVTSVVILAPPRSPAAFADGSRMSYTYNAAARTVTLRWQASPS